MKENIIVDTGPLIALIDNRDRRHAWARAQFADIVPPLRTCEAVLSEAIFLSRRVAGGLPAILGLFEKKVCSLEFVLAPTFEEVAAKLQRYAEIPMSLADGCLVRMSESLPDSVILTLDGDFRVYRRHKREKIPLLIPPDV